MSRVAMMSALLAGSILGVLMHRHGLLAAAGRAIGAPAPWGNAAPANTAALRTPLLSAFPGRSPLAMLGDSNIELAPWGALLGRNVVNHGVSGDTTDGVLERVDAVKVTGAETVVLMIGINDLRRGDRVSTIAERYSRILGRLSGMQVIALAVLTGEPNQKVRVRALNAAIAAACSARCRFLGLEELVVDGLLRPEMSPDRLHLTPDGYRALARSLDAALPVGQPR